MSQVAATDRLAADQILAPSDLSITVFKTAASFEAWWEAAKTPSSRLAFQDPRLMTIWERTLGAGMKVTPLVVRVDDLQGAPLLALYLCLERAGGATILRFMDGGVIDYNAPILFDGASRIDISARDLWTTIRAALPPHDAIDLEKMPPTVNGARNPLSDDTFEARDFGHAMTLPADWADAIQEKASTETMKVWRKKLRRLHKQGAVRHVVATEPAEVETIFATLVALKRRRLADNGFYDLFLRPGFEDFYRQSLGFAESGLIYLSALYVDDEIVATSFGFKDSQRITVVLSGFAAGEWSKFSCGNLEFEMLLEWATKQGFSSFDFGLGNEEYKMFWCDEHIELRRLKMATSTVGRMRDMMATVRWGANKVLGRVGKSA